MKKLLPFLLFVAAGLASAQTLSVVTRENLIEANRNFSTTLSADINNSTLTIPLTSGAGITISVPGAIVIAIGTTPNVEYVKLCSISGNTATACAGGRGFSNTSALSHSSGAAVVGGLLTPESYNAIVAALAQTTQALGTNLAGLVVFQTTAPATCTANQLPLWYDTNATAGENLFGCTATNTWTLLSGGGGGDLSETDIDTSAKIAAIVGDETGTNVLVFNTSPTLITPDLGTPSSAVLTNATGLPVSTGISGLGAGVATALATPSSANVATAVTDETGSGALVFGTSPALTTPDLGTPSAAVLTNATGLPISTGVSGLGSGVADALAAGGTDCPGDGIVVLDAQGVVPDICLPTSTGMFEWFLEGDQLAVNPHSLVKKALPYMQSGTFVSLSCVACVSRTDCATAASVDINFDARALTALATATTDLHTSEFTCDNDSLTTTTFSGDDVLAANEVMNMSISDVTDATVLWVWLSIEADQ